MHKFDEGGSARQIAYHEYLRSDHWVELKAKKELETPKKCSACSDLKNVQLHHMRYRETFEDTQLRDTCWLCKGCHSKFHHRAGVKLKDHGDDANLLARTIRIINKDRKSPKSKTTNRKQCRAMATQLRREAKAARRAKAAEQNRVRQEKIALGIIRPKIKKPKKDAETNQLLSQIKPGSPLRSSRPGAVVFVKAEAEQPWGGVFEKKHVPQVAPVIHATKADRYRAMSLAYQDTGLNRRDRRLLAGNPSRSHA